MGHNGVPSVDYPGVIPSFIEHTHIQVQDVGQIDRALGGAFVRADGHHVVAVDLKIVIGEQKSLYKLIGGTDGLKSA